MSVVYRLLSCSAKNLTLAELLQNGLKPLGRVGLGIVRSEPGWAGRRRVFYRSADLLKTFNTSATS